MTVEKTFHDFLQGRNIYEELIVSLPIEKRIQAKCDFLFRIPEYLLLPLPQEAGQIANMPDTAVSVQVPSTVLAAADGLLSEKTRRIITKRNGTNSLTVKRKTGDNQSIQLGPTEKPIIIYTEEYEDIPHDIDDSGYLHACRVQEITEITETEGGQYYISVRKKIIDECYITAEGEKIVNEEPKKYDWQNIEDSDKLEKSLNTTIILVQRGFEQKK